MSFDVQTGQIRTTVGLDSTASNSVLADLQSIAAQRLIDKNRQDISDTISATVVRARHPIMDGDESNTDHRQE